MKHKRVSIQHALNGCRICAAVLLEKKDLRDIIKGRLEEVVYEKD